MSRLSESSLEWALFSVSLGSIILIFALAVVSAFRSEFQFFPPPSKQSWQHRTFLLLFRLFLYPLIALTVIAFEPVPRTDFALRYGFGGLLFVCGFGMAFWITLNMGWRNAFGEKRGLVTDGCFRFSRNPIYVATWVGLAGWGLIANQLPVTILLLAWSILYVLAPFFEEPWLEAQYGAAYRDYKARTRRFV
ncbi:phosphatidylethanolamine N-methyltransferase family protein [Qipengyuania sp. S6317L1]|uniref:methyltransferase family protein n=1 Tax=Qipengyuania sp. S6317L1 TaxID=2926410 RepID=UPI001FF6F72E|nr:PEMT/PEM2 methyltransferase family protein [Qipengyuania sp. S6317L1]MCK0097819.1 phosphatidylethanolamine N-methyltransferase family protein [Qipengyuania sp. S6317L1]